MATIKETNVYDLPAYYASALINDDWSGLDDTDEVNLRQWLGDNKPGYCVNVSKESFYKTYEGLLTDCLTYTFHTYE